MSDTLSAPSGKTPTILVVSGSPRRDGNSDRLLNAFMTGAQQAGARVDQVIAADLVVSACRGCNACALTGECVVHDAMYDLYDRIDAADAIAIATPVYFAGVPAVLKIMIDRLQPYYARYYELGQDRPPRRPGAILLVRAGGDPFGHEAAEATIRSVYAVLGIDVEGVVSITGVDGPSDIGRHPDEIAAARELGSTVARRITR